MEFNDYCSYKSYLYNLYLHLVFTCVLEQILGRAFGVLRCLNRCAFYGQYLGVGYSLLIILFWEARPWLIGVACVVVMGNLWTIFYSTVSLRMLYGVKFMQCLWYQRRLILYFLYGGIGLGSTCPLHGIWFCPV